MKIVKKTEFQIIIRSGLFYVLIDHFIAFFPAILAIMLVLISISKNAPVVLYVVPALLVWSLLASFVLGISLNLLKIDRSTGTLTQIRIGPWLPGKKRNIRLGSVSSLEFIYTGHNVPFNNFLIFHLRGDDAGKKRCPLFGRIILHERWLLKLDEDLFAKHKEIASFMGVEYRIRRLGKDRN